MSNAIGIYTNDGIAVSFGGEYTSPVKFKLNAEENESQIQRLTIRMEDGFQLAGKVTIFSTFGERVTFCKTADGEFTNTISFNELNGDTEFYIKATSADTELPTLEKTTGIAVSAPFE